MIRLLLTDGHAPTREALRTGLASLSGIEVVGEASTGDELLNRFSLVPLALVVLDLNLPGLNLPGPDVFALLGRLHVDFPINDAAVRTAQGLSKCEMEVLGLV